MRRISPFAPACALVLGFPLGASMMGPVPPLAGVRSVYPMVNVSPYVPGPTAVLERELRESVSDALHEAKLVRGGPVATLKVSVAVEDNPECPDLLAIRTSFALQEMATVAREEERRLPFAITWQRDLMAVVRRDRAFEAARDQTARLLKVLLSEISEQNRPDVPEDGAAD